MNSLKAISTGPRRTEFLLILLFVLLLPLSAEDWRAGVINRGADDGFLSLFTSTMEMGGSVLSSEDKLETAEERLREELILSDMKAEAAAARSEKGYTKKETAKTSGSWKVVPVVLKDVPEEDIPYLMEGDPDALSWYEAKMDLDELWILDGAERDGLTETAVIRDGKEELLFLTGPEWRARDEKRLLSYFLSEYREDEVFLLSVTGNVSGDILVDGEPAERLGSYVVLSSPTAGITVKRPLYEDASYSVDVGVDDTLEYRLLPIEGESLFVSTIPYTDDISHNGVKAEGGYIPTPTLPFTVSVKKDGYESAVLSSPESIGLLEPMLFPSELRDEGRLLDARDRFYTDLILTLSGFGAGVISSVVDSLVETDLSGLQTFSYGISVFQLIRTIDSLFEYKDAMRFGL